VVFSTLLEINQVRNRGDVDAIPKAGLCFAAWNISATKSGQIILQVAFPGFAVVGTERQMARRLTQDMRGAEVQTQIQFD
jgi:hypothetical protein